MYQRLNKKTAAHFFCILSGAFSLSLLSSCAVLSPKSISDVPTINVANVKVPPLKNIPQKAVTLTVLDNRDPEFKKNSEELRSELQRAIVSILKSEGINIDSKSGNSLLVSVQDQAMGKYKDGCVKMNALLSIPQVANLYSDATSCFELKSPVSSVSMGSDINESYEMALSTVFQNLATNLQTLGGEKVKTAPAPKKK